MCDKKCQHIIKNVDAGTGEDFLNMKIDAKQTHREFELQAESTRSLQALSVAKKTKTFPYHFITCKDCGETPVPLKNDNGSYTGRLGHTCYETGESLYMSESEWNERNHTDIRCGTCKYFFPAVDNDSSFTGSKACILDGTCTLFNAPVPSSEDKGVHLRSCEPIWYDDDGTMHPENPVPYQDWYPMTNQQFFFGTADRSAKMTVTDIVDHWKDSALVVVKSIHQNGKSVCVIAEDDYLDWLAQPHFCRKEDE